MFAHCLTSDPATQLSLLRALAAYRDEEIRRASVKVMARHVWCVSLGAHRALRFRRGDGGRGEADHRQRIAAAAGGEEPTWPRPHNL